MRITLMLLALLLGGCAVRGQEMISTPAANYIRLTEYGAGYPMVGGVQGCQVAGEGSIGATIVLRTDNCAVEVLGQ